MSNKTGQLNQSGTNQSYGFGDFELDGAERVLRRNGEIVSLRLKPFEVLLVLLERRGRVVSKEELIERVWPDSFVDEANLARHVYTLRRALGERPRENGGQDHFIQTVPGRGYRFVASVRELDGEEDERGIHELPAASGAAPAAYSPAKRWRLAGAIIKRWRSAAIALAALIAVVTAVIYFSKGAKVIGSIFPDRERERLANRRNIDPEAHQAYLKGRYQWNKRTSAGLRKAMEYFNEAIARDPNYAPPYSGLADCYSLMEGLAPTILPPNEAYPKAKQAAMKALRIDDQSAEAHASLGRIKLNYDWDWPGAEKEFKLAIQIDPNYPTAHQWYSVYLTYLGRHTEAIVEAQRAYALDPISLATSRDLAAVYYRARQYDQAIAQCQKMLDLDPQAYVRLRGVLELIYEQLGWYDQAVAEQVKAMTVLGAVDKAVALRAAYDESGWKGYLQKTADSITERAMTGKVGSFSMAKVHARLGDKDRTFEWLEKAYANRSSGIISIKSDPAFDWLHADPRFQYLLRRLGLASYR
jgi:DNA-binding winged helix-turn-helix (wHTH) protein/Tfp pilus assembly protein PilF